VQSIEESSVKDLAATIKKHSPNVVIWSAGAGGGSPERTKAVDHEGKSNSADLIMSSSSHADFEKKGAVKVFDATAAAGVKRFIIVSAVDIRDRVNKPTPEWQDTLTRPT
jgi:hypothetical protein